MALAVNKIRGLCRDVQRQIVHTNCIPSNKRSERKPSDATKRVYIAHARNTSLNLEHNSGVALRDSNCITEEPNNAQNGKLEEGFIVRKDCHAHVFAMMKTPIRPVRILQAKASMKQLARDKGHYETRETKPPYTSYAVFCTYEAEAPPDNRGPAETLTTLSVMSIRPRFKTTSSKKIERDRHRPKQKVISPHTPHLYEDHRHRIYLTAPP